MACAYNLSIRNATEGSHMLKVDFEKHSELQDS